MAAFTRRFADEAYAGLRIVTGLLFLSANGAGIWSADAMRSRDRRA
jgi:uncharacterized membrane protein YphA (DoxX/SURF4 family)